MHGGNALQRMALRCSSGGIITTPVRKRRQLSGFKKWGNIMVRSLAFVCAFIFGMLPAGCQQHSIAAKKYVVAVPVPAERGESRNEAMAVFRAIKLYLDRFGKPAGEPSLEARLFNYPENVENIANQIKKDPQVVAVIGFSDSKEADITGKIFNEHSGDLLRLEDLEAKSEELWKKQHEGTKTEDNDADRPRKGLVMITPSAVNREVTAGKNWVFSMNCTGDMQVDYIATQLRRQLDKKVIVLHSVNYRPDASGPTTRFLGLAKARGIDVELLSLPQRDKALRDNLSKSWTKISEIIMFCDDPDTARQAISEIKEANRSFTIIGYPDRLWSHRFINHHQFRANLGCSPGPIFQVCHPFLFEFGSSSTHHFVERYKTVTSQEPTVSAAFAYDAAKLLYDAFRTSHRHGFTTLIRSGIRLHLDTLRCERTAVPAATGRIYFRSDNSVARPGIMCIVTKNKAGVPHFVPFEHLIFAHSPPTDISLQHSADRRPSQPTKTHVISAKVYPHRLYDVDVVKGTFDMEFFLRFEGYKDSEFPNLSKVSFLNRHPDVAPQVKEIHRSVGFPPGNDGIRERIYKIKGKFLNKFKLARFPFDNQDLALRIIPSESSTRGVPIRLVAVEEKERDYDLPWARPPTGCDVWRDIGPAKKGPIGILQAEELRGIYTSPVKRGHVPLLEAHIKISRARGMYLVKIMLPLLILGGIGFLVLFWVPPDQFEVRMTVAVTTLLAMIVHHLTQTQTEHAAGQFLWIDVGYILAYAFMGIVMVAAVWQKPKAAKVKGTSDNSGEKAGKAVLKS